MSDGATATGEVLTTEERENLLQELLRRMRRVQRLRIAESEICLAYSYDTNLPFAEDQKDTLITVREKISSIIQSEWIKVLETFEKFGGPIRVIVTSPFVSETSQEIRYCFNGISGLTISPCFVASSGTQIPIGQIIGIKFNNLPKS